MPNLRVLSRCTAVQVRRLAAARTRVVPLATSPGLSKRSRRKAGDPQAPWGSKFLGRSSVPGWPSRWMASGWRRRPLYPASSTSRTRTRPRRPIAAPSSRSVVARRESARRLMISTYSMVPPMRPLIATSCARACVSACTRAVSCRGHGHGYVTIVLASKGLRQGWSDRVARVTRGTGVQTAAQLWGASRVTAVCAVARLRGG